ncbi:hypothetical protein AAY473_005739 [Plecturocebus cupreus]
MEQKLDHRLPQGELSLVLLGKGVDLCHCQRQPYPRQCFLFRIVDPGPPENWSGPAGFLGANQLQGLATPLLSFPQMSVCKCTLGWSSIQLHQSSPCSPHHQFYVLGLHVRSGSLTICQMNKTLGLKMKPCGLECPSDQESPRKLPSWLEAQGREEKGKERKEGDRKWVPHQKG